MLFSVDKDKEVRLRCNNWQIDYHFHLSVK